MDDSEGEQAVRIARQFVEAEARGIRTLSVRMPDSFAENRGVFVSLHGHGTHLLRGCIGIPEPVYPLSKAIEEAARSVCHDPRFPPLDEEETDHVVVEVSILTPPEEIVIDDRRQLPQKVAVGRDGLIAERGPFRGLLLPQVPVEWGWDAEEFLGQTCMKAGMSPDCWLDKRSKFYKFQGEIFSEQEPRGEVKRKEIE